MSQQGPAPTPAPIGETLAEMPPARPSPLSKAAPLPTAIITPRIITQLLLVIVVMVVSLYLLLRK